MSRFMSINNFLNITIECLYCIANIATWTYKTNNTVKKNKLNKMKN